MDKRARLSAGVNMSSGSPLRLILHFAWPLLLGNLFQQLYNMADTVIVGRTVGAQALGAVGGCGAVTGLLLGFVNGFCSGMSVVTARRFGGDDFRGVRQSFAVCMALGSIGALLITGIGLACAGPLLTLMGTPAALYEDAYVYINIIFLGTVAPVFFNLLFCFLRAVGDSKTPLLFLSVACALNVLLDYGFILIFKIGVAGVAVATVVSQVVSALLCAALILRRMPWLRLTRADFAGIVGDAFTHVRLGMPVALQSIVIAVGMLVTQAALNGLGATGVIACVAAQKIDGFSMLPLMSVGIAVATYVAHNVGAGKPERVRQGVRQAVMLNVGYALCATSAVLLFGRPLLASLLPNAEPGVRDQAYLFLSINGALYVIVALMFVFRNALIGLGRSELATAAGMIEMAMRCFAAVVLARVFGFVGVCFANPLAWIGAMAFVTLMYYKMFGRAAGARATAEGG